MHVPAFLAAGPAAAVMPGYLLGYARPLALRRFDRIWEDWEGSASSRGARR